MKTLAEIGNTFTMQDGEGIYKIEFAKGSHLVLTAGVKVDNPAAYFMDVNVVAKYAHISEVKHYRHNGGKYWTQYATFNYVFVIPKTKIELIEKPGYSWVGVKIGNQTYHLNVCGGSNPERGWTDYVGPECHIGIGHGVKSLKNLAAHAECPQACLGAGIYLAPNYLSKDQVDNFLRLAYADMAKKSMGVGDRVFLRSGFSVGCDKDPEMYIYEMPKRKQMYLCMRGQYEKFRIRFKAIDWKRVAEHKDIQFPLLEFNRLHKLEATA